MINYERYSKLQGLGIPIPKHIEEQFELVDSIFRKLKKAKNYEYPGSDFYIDVEENNTVYIEDPKNGFLWCIWKGFWENLENSYVFEYSEIQSLLKVKLFQYFKLENLTPQMHFIEHSIGIGQPFQF